MTTTSRPRLGFAVGYDPSASVGDMAALMARAEARGFDTGFFSETFYTNRDSVSAVAAFATATSRIALGTTQVVRLRSPLVMAQTAASLDELSGGRFVLVVGACTDKHAARNGLPPQAPGVVLREYVECVRRLLTGAQVTFRGRYVSLDGVGLNWTPARADIPIWIAAASPLGLRIAGEIADGVLLDAGTSPEYSANALAIARQARRAAGLDWAGFTVAQLVNTSIEETKAAALEAVRWEVASKFKYPSTARGKVLVGEPNISPDAPAELSSIYAEKGLDALLAAIPDGYVEALTAAGPVPEVRRRLERYRAAGVDLPLVRAATARQVDRLLGAVEELTGPAGEARDVR
ncbi:LLM class flavin-dependent oxidoreductase [Phytohabitans sp. ZYX-F-186]|uniref:LLM class flavin-dependent oxidoreductase n=1 Tax=Phytohabitans maris TaxID=3071409 RepID=A0ABU0ZDT8_9ACTN|nr:LLM class flavin-dependent oxidoreductase [Phytohabitans sp. ZYX-F-186]MDQ7905203.1 LLM class flavin-dependent oxidoreductase [Phytohabitans sp. ZYX-F-186]